MPNHLPDYTVSFPVTPTLALKASALIRDVAARRWYLARLIFDPEDGGDTPLRNVSSHTD
jgi:hypothetical protein